MALKSSSACSVSKELKEGEKCRAGDTHAKLSVSAISNDCTANRKKIQKRKTYSVHNKRIAHIEKYCGESSSDSEVDKTSLPFTKYIKHHLSGDDKKAKNQKKENQNCKKFTVRVSKDEIGRNEEWNKIVPEVVHLMYPVFMPRIWQYLGYFNAVKDESRASTSSSENEDNNKIPLITNIKTSKPRNWFNSRGDIVTKVEVGDQLFSIKRKVLVQHSLVFRKALQSNDPLPVSLTLNHVLADEFKIIKHWMEGKKQVINMDNAIDIMVVAKRLEMPELFTECKSIIRCPGGADEKKESKSEAKKRKKEEKAKAKADKKEAKRKKKEAEKSRGKDQQLETDSTDISIRETARKIDSQSSILDDAFPSERASTTGASETTNGSSYIATTAKNDYIGYPSTMNGAASTDAGTIITGSMSNATLGSTKTATTIIKPTKVKSNKFKCDKHKNETDNEVKTKKAKTDVAVSKMPKTDKLKGGMDRKIQRTVEPEVNVDDKCCKRRRKSEIITNVKRATDRGCAHHHTTSEPKRKQYEDKPKKEEWALTHGPCCFRISPLPDVSKEKENQNNDWNGVPDGMLRLENGKYAVLVDKAKAMQESRRLKRLIEENDDDDRSTAVSISKINRVELINLAAWIKGDKVVITPANIIGIMTLAKRLEMPVLMLKTRRYQMDVDNGCRTPREIFIDDWLTNKLENNSSVKISQEQSVSTEIESCGEIESLLPFQRTENSVDSTEVLPEPVRFGLKFCAECPTSTCQTESTISTATTNTEEESCKTLDVQRKITSPIDDCDNNNNNNNNLIMDTIAHLFRWNQKKENLCEISSCRTANQKLMKSIQLLLYQENIVLGESYCGGNELDPSDFTGPAPILKFPFDGYKYHWVIGEPSICHAFCAAVVFQGKLYVSGGRNICPPKNSSSLAVRDIWRYDCYHNKWCQIGTMCVNRIHHCAVIFEDSIYFVGGLDEKLRMLPSVERLEIKNESVSICEVSPLSVARAGASGTAHGCMLFVAGGISSHPAGNSGCHILDRVECYNSTFDKWHTVAPLGIPRAFATIISTNIGLCVIGGVTCKNIIDPTLECVCSIPDVEIYGNLRLRPTPTLIKPRYAASAVVHNGHLYVFGGIELETGCHLPVVERFSITQQNWVLADDKFSTQLMTHGS